MHVKFADIQVKAAKQGKKFYEGRPKKFSNEQIDYAMKLLKEYSYSEVAKMTGISKSTLMRYRKEDK